VGETVAAATVESKADVMPENAGGDQVTTGCCIVGGGPAGMMLGFLLARAGVRVMVLEKHRDFLRDFRGDTIHPSTLEIMHELGLLESFLALPHQEATHLSGVIGDTTVRIADFTHLPTQCKFIALMPQWDFLNFIAEQGKRYPAFDVRMQTEATGLIEENGRVVGVRATTSTGPLAIRTPLVVGADGRHSVVRARAGLAVEDLGAPIDVLWMRLSRHPSESGESLGRFGVGKILVMINRGDYWQCAFVIPKGAADTVKAAGIEAFRSSIAALVPALRDRVDELKSFDDVKLLTVSVDRLRTWYRPGLLCIGDAAHAMSPVGGVGINLAIQDAVAAANRLAGPLLTGTVSEADLEAVQRRRTFPTRATQRMQIFIQNNILRRVLAAGVAPSAPWPLRLVGRWPLLQRIPARLVGLGFRPEHVKTPVASV
jgi:2-polyprenyl-6-methoxyphenol hydroxylase-like FAD-dependent oxidoreductase